MLTESVKEYYSLTKKNEVREAAKKLRRKFLRYKDAEIVSADKSRYNVLRAVRRHKFLQGARIYVAAEQ